MVFLTILIAASAVSASPVITIKRAPTGYVAEVASFDIREQETIDADINRRAESLCQGKSVRWGRFTSQTNLGKQPGSTPPIVKGYAREFSCVVAERRVYELAPADWKPMASDEADVRRAFEAYYARRDSGDFGPAWAMFEPGTLSDLTSWSNEMRAFNTKLGRGTRRITGVTWYVNPESAPHPGIYAAVDFIGEFPTVYFYCGYVGFYRRSAGSYEITREEQNQFARGDGTANPVGLAQMRASMCRGE